MWIKHWKKYVISKKTNYNEGINYKEENKFFKEENQLNYKRGVMKVHDNFIAWVLDF